jgi:predicted ATPase with chaperone activity
MFLFSSKKSKNEKGLNYDQDESSKSMKQQRSMRESQEIRDLRKRAKDAQKKRGDSLKIESVMVINEGLEFRKSTIDIDIKGNDIEEFEVFKFTLSAKN